MRIRTILITLAAVFFVGCMNKQAVPEPLVINSKTACHSINLKLNQRLVVQLKANPTTGYQWILTEHPSFLKIIHENVYQPDDYLKGMVGVGGQTEWSFQAQAKGNAALVLIYQQPWEKEQVAKTFKCIINVD